MIIERHGERIDLAEEVSGPCGLKYNGDQLVAYLALSIEQSYIDPREADGEWSDDNGSGALRFGRRIFSWNDGGWHTVDRFDTVAEAEAAMPRSFDDYVADLEALPVVAEQLAGFGIELASSSPYEQLTNVLSLGFVVCEALRTVGHDFGHYRLVTALDRLGYRRGVTVEDDESWLVRDGDEQRPVTDEEISAEAFAREAAGEDFYRWAQLAEIGRYFYRDDSEAEAIALVEAIGACLGAAKLEGVEL